MSMGKGQVPNEGSEMTYLPCAPSWISLRLSDRFRYGDRKRFGLWDGFWGCERSAFAWLTLFIDIC